MQISNLKIGARLAIGFALVLVLAGVMTGLGIWRLHDMQSAIAAMDNAALKERLANQWYLGNIANAIRTTARVKTTSAEDDKFYQAEMTAQSAEIGKIQKELEALITRDEGKQLMRVVGEKRKEYMDARNEVFRLKALGTPESEAAFKKMLASKMNPAMDSYNQSVLDVVNYQHRVFSEEQTAADAMSESGRNLLIIIGVVALAAGAALAWLLSRSIVRPISYAVSVARTVAAGDLSKDIRVQSKDEAGELMQALKDMNDSLAKIVAEVRAGTETIATGSAQVAAGSQDLSARTEQQASSLEETASSMEELTSTVKQNAENARQANVLAGTASEVASKGGEVIGQVVGTMGEIHASANKIVDIISVIDGIAFQTNILALNAAVEAARAGEQGRGFAVVASEVRTLAQRSANAAKEIKSLIDDSVEKVEAGSQLVNSAGTTMNEIVESVRRVTDIMAEISSASAEQTAGIDQINQAVTQMDSVTQQNAALVEEAAAASESMQHQAASLANTVSIFRLANSHVATALTTPRSKHVAKQPPRAIVTTGNTTLSAPRRREPTSTAIARNAAASGDWEEF
ncbi:methyl-accepting chemotaxis protein [Noviherbaspirillum pedocola]|uniref:MCP four helix bundle domain-containing protein n=1 Tax=Noviherbaspirillum pedocola TaxID=2801341 RepID=A0A934SX31_9BURK|nr:methyl-accepting chemotaxis protein [Noviherbaspirillum pedocola]MBK4738421.1 MCP four helix bundle domain-containing protein [Noviherbaspirillum pedocola]